MSEPSRDALSSGAASDAIERWFGAALAAADPAAAVARAIRRSGSCLLLGNEVVPVAGRVVVVGVGKAAPAMAAGAERVLGDRIAGGVVVTKDGHGQAAPAALERIEIREAAHPIPDARGVAATEEMLRLLAGVGAGDVVVALISGGGSALLEAPRAPATLADLGALTETLLRAGAPIQHLNTVRRALSRVKAGGLRRAGGAARFVTLILSDVLGNDLPTIASGPTVRGRADPVAALALLESYGVERSVPNAIVAVLKDRRDEDDAEPAWEHDRVRVVADNGTALGAATEAAIDDGLCVEAAWHDKEGEAADLGRAWAHLAIEALPEVDVLIGGGEATVTVRGDGVGGRNTEFALAAACELAALGADAWVVASLATDGQDGPAGVAGAIADADTILRASAAGVDPAEALRRNDSLAVFAAAGGAVAPGPTGTNVNDLYFAVRRSAVERSGVGSGDDAG